ncbi:MAG: TIGR02757 family protein [Bacteroidota bacterium]
MNRSLKQKLDYHYKFFDKSQISPDPLEFLHRYSNYHDIEISGILSSVFAYGNVKQIITTLEKLHSAMSNKPYEFVMNFDVKRDAAKLNNIKHRFFSMSDIIKLFIALNKIYKVYGSLKYLFLLYYFEKDNSLKDAVSFFSKHLTDLIAGGSKPTHAIKFMFPDPHKGSACKRMNLFLRWMVRNDDLDFGLWYEIPTSKLIVPVDTHVAKICKRLKLSKQKNVSWKMAEEITEQLKRFDPNDPVKYDFAICHIGMRGLKL